MDGLMSSKNPAAVPPTSVPLFNPDDVLSIEEVAARLKTDVGWVREKIRRRCPNRMPAYNLGRHLLFHWPSVCAWIANCPRPVHAVHPPRRKVKKPQMAKVAA
jgi:excisionase family DNA binding protein